MSLERDWFIIIFILFVVINLRKFPISNLKMYLYRLKMIDMEKRIRLQTEQTMKKKFGYLFGKKFNGESFFEKCNLKRFGFQCYS